MGFLRKLARKVKKATSVVTKPLEKVTKPLMGAANPLAGRRGRGLLKSVRKVVGKTPTLGGYLK